MKTLYFLLGLLLISERNLSQQLIADFEGNDFVSFSFYNGSLDSQFINPAVSNANQSSHCLRYIRDTNTYAIIKIIPTYTCINISPYLSNNFNAPKISIKVFSNSPVGTYVSLQLGIKNDDQYPQGIHSEFFAVTTTQNSWETLIFSYLQSTPNTPIAVTDIDKIILLIAPGTNLTDTFYIDDIISPDLNTTLHVAQYSNNDVKKLNILRSNPNPAKDITTIQFSIPTDGEVKVSVSDLLGSKIIPVNNIYLKNGIHVLPIDLKNLPGGIYFITVQQATQSVTEKLIIDK